MQSSVFRHRVLLRRQQAGALGRLARTRGGGVVDLLLLLAAWGTDPGGPPDFDGDGTVGITDLLELLANWGPCP